MKHTTFREAVSPPELYCITDTRLSTLSHEQQINAMIAGGARIIQLRDKTIDDATFLTLATRALALCNAANAILVINDRPHVAAQSAAHALHLGQDDISPRHARRIINQTTWIGISIHNREQLQRAIDEPVDYIALGPVFGTQTKQNPDPPIGLELVRHAADLLHQDPRPLVLIGGITLQNLQSVRDAAPLAIIASIGAILAPGVSIQQRVRQFRQRILTPSTTRSGP